MSIDIVASRISIPWSLNPYTACVPSQNGFSFECPQRKSAYCADAGKALPSSHSVDSPAALTPIISRLSDTEPETM